MRRRDRLKNAMSKPARSSIALALVLILAAGVAPSGAAENLHQAIQYLLDFVAGSDVTFIRNGATYSGKEAAAHMKAKYDYFKREIKTAEDFIRLAASKSELSGRAYLVRTREGKEIPSAEWLASALNDYRAAQKRPERSPS